MSVLYCYDIEPLNFFIDNKTLNCRQNIWGSNIHVKYWLVSGPCFLWIYTLSFWIVLRFTSFHFTYVCFQMYVNKTFPCSLIQVVGVQKVFLVSYLLFNVFSHKSKPMAPCVRFSAFTFSWQCYLGIWYRTGALVCHAKSCM